MCVGEKWRKERTREKHLDPSLVEVSQVFRRECSDYHGTKGRGHEEVSEREV